MAGRTRSSEFGDALHAVALSRLRRRGRWLLLLLCLAALAAAAAVLAF